MKTIVDLTEELKEYSLEKDTAAKQAVEANIAPVEADASSASRAYVVGEQLFLNDVLYDVTSPISVGDAIVVNTNITAANKLSADIKSKIDDLYSKNQTLTSAFTNNINENGCKNLFFYLDQSGTNAGITTSRNEDDSFSLTAGTATSNFMFPRFNEAWTQKIGNSLKKGITYIFSIGTSNSNMSLEVYHYHNNSPTRLAYVDGGSEVAFTIPSGFIDGDGIWARVWITSGKTIPNITLYPMIRLATDIDSTYVPPSKTNHQLTQDSVTWDNLSEVGAVNYCKNNATTTTTTDGTTTFTWTVNDDKSVTVSAPSYPVTVASNQILIPWDNISADECSNLVGKVFKLSGCPSGGSRDTYRLQIYRVSSADGSTGTAEEYGEGNVFTWENNGSGTKAKVQMVIASGYTMTGPLTFKPMLTDVSYNGPYVPYAKSNKELTDYADYIDSLTGYSVSDFNYKPTKAPFINYVGNASQWANPIADAGTNGGTLLWLGRLDTAVRLSQVFICNNGNIYTRLARADDISGTWTYGPWHTITATS